MSAMIRDLSFSEIMDLRDVEKTLEWYGNRSGRPGLMGALTESGAFAAHYNLARWLRAKRLFDADRSAASRAKALEEYTESF